MIKYEVYLVRNVNFIISTMMVVVTASNFIEAAIKAQDELPGWASKCVTNDLADC